MSTKQEIVARAAAENPEASASELQRLLKKQGHYISIATIHKGKALPRPQLSQHELSNGDARMANLDHMRMITDCIKKIGSREQFDFAMSALTELGL